MFWDLCYQDVTSATTPDICVSFLHNTCSSGQKCRKIHTKYPFLWQSEIKGRWHSLPEFDSKKVEEAFRVVSMNGVFLTPDDKINREQYFYFAHEWYVDFDKMSLNLTKPRISYKIRRLSSPSSSLVKDTMATDFVWYYKDVECNAWIPFDQHDSLGSGSWLNYLFGGSRSCPKSLTSDEIDLAYSTNSTLSFAVVHAGHLCTIDLKDMSIKDQVTKMSRPIRRRVKQKLLVMGKGLEAEFTPDVSLCRIEEQKPLVMGMESKAELAPEVGKKLKNSSELEWQFFDNAGSWISYEKPNSAKKLSCATKTTSADIEKHYIANPDKHPRAFRSQDQRCLFDFENMIQINLVTLVKKPIRRVHILGNSQNSRALQLPKSSRLPGMSDFQAATITKKDKHKWYFQDESKNWIKYGQPNSSKMSDYITTASSDDIDKDFNDNPNRCLEIESQKFTYILDFAKMTQTNKNTRTVRPIRRKLKTASSTPLSNIGELSVKVTCEWYFLTPEMTWIKFGGANQKNEYSTSTTSSDIEKHFCQQPQTLLQVSLGQNTYTLDFTEMTQTNTKGGDKRPIHRVTKIISLSSRTPPSPMSKPLMTPPNWLRMDSQNTAWTTVSLDSFAPEYAKIMSLIRSSQMPFNAFPVKQILRIQNPYLYEAYANRVIYMSKIYPNTQFRQMQLFHGTSSDNVDSICEENLDWRLHGQENGRTFGQGAYFTNSVDYASKYSTSGRRYIFIMTVLVGETVRGTTRTTKTSSRGSGRSFDTSVDSLMKPYIFVKYDSHEYYPEYVFEF